MIQVLAGPRTRCREMKHEKTQSTAQLYYRLCSDHLSIEAIPKKKIRVDFERMREQPVMDHELVMWTPHFVILRNQNGEEITLRPDGRMLVRKSASEAVARQSAAGVLALLQNFAL